MTFSVRLLMLLSLFALIVSGCSIMNRHAGPVLTPGETSWEFDGKSLSAKEYIKMANGFGAVLCLSDSQEFINDWQNVFKMPIVNMTSLVSKNHPLFMYLLVVNPGSDGDGGNEVIYDLKVTDSSGGVYADFKNRNIFINKVKLSKNQIQRAENYTSILVEDKELYGKYHVEAVVHDKIKGVSLSLSRDFYVYDTVRYSDGIIYTGELRDDLPNGFGSITYPNGNRYQGDFLDGKRHGKGMLTTPDGSTFEGEWSENELNGQGTANSANGTKYTGQFKGSIPNGLGTITYGNGDKYVGMFSNFKPNGEGTYYVADGCVYTGQMKDGAWDGLGKLAGVHGGGFVYEGEFTHGEANGKGKLTLPDGTVDTGTWDMNKIIKNTVWHK